MDRTAIAVGQTEEITNETSDNSLCELSDLQLAFVGGGCADPIYH